jgi:probable HAF family extracellular repeat protein
VDHSLGLAINAAGNVTGSSWLTSNPHAGGIHAFRYVNGIGMADLGVLPPAGANFSFGYGINSFGQIAGGSFAAEGGSAVRAMLATATGLIDLGTLSNTDDASVAFDINDRASDGVVRQQCGRHPHVRLDGGGRHARHRHVRWGLQQRTIDQ